MSSFSWFTPPPVSAPPSNGGVLETGDFQVNGRDILFTDDFQITAAGDYALVDGDRNLRQAIFNRLQTRMSDFAPRQEYGVGVQIYVKKTASKSNLDALRQRIREQLLLDSRVELVEEVTLELSQASGGAKLTCFIRVRSLGRELRLEPLQFTEAT